MCLRFHFLEFLIFWYSLPLFQALNRTNQTTREQRNFRGSRARGIGVTEVQSNQIGKKNVC